MPSSEDCRRKERKLSHCPRVSFRVSGHRAAQLCNSLEAGGLLVAAGLLSHSLHWLKARRRRVSSSALESRSGARRIRLRTRNGSGTPRFKMNCNNDLRRQYRFPAIPYRIPYRAATSHSPLSECVWFDLLGDRDSGSFLQFAVGCLHPIANLSQARSARSPVISPEIVLRFLPVSCPSLASA